MNIAICDDENKWINAIEEYLIKFQKNYTDVKWDIYYGAEELIEEYKNSRKPYDLIITDIKMPDINGINMAAHIRNLDRTVLIIFLTSYEEYIRDCFSCMPLGFWDKLISYDKFEADMKNAYELLKNRKMCFSFKWDGQDMRVPYNEILYVNNNGRKVEVHTFNKIYKFTGRLKDHIEVFYQNDIVMTHKSFCVNMAFIKNKDSKSVCLFNGECITISSACRKNFESEYIRYIKRESGM